MLDLSIVSQSIDIFLYLLWHADTLVWCVALVLSCTAGAILHNYAEDALFSIVISVALFASIMVANVAFTYLGIVFTSSKDSNIVAAAGAAICSVTAIALITVRLLNAIGEHTNRLKGEG